MSGCDWQKKSFLVSMKPKKKEIEKCSKCKDLIVGIKYKFNDDILCRNCFANKPSLAKRSGLGFSTPKDKLFEFTTSHLGKRFEIRSKGQWKKFMREHGLHDDVPKKPNFSKQTYKPVPRKEIAEKMMERLQERGAYHKLVPELRRALKRR